MYVLRSARCVARVYMYMYEKLNRSSGRMMYFEMSFAKFIRTQAVSNRISILCE